jgi:hypothetical protein
MRPHVVEAGVPSNNEMKLTKPAMARMARSSQLISVFCGRQEDGRD